MLVIGLILFGMLIGAGAQLILGRSAHGVDWGLAIVAGLVGSFVGGLLISLLSGDGVNFRPSGIIGSLVGALIVTGGWIWFRKREGAARP
ncbi:MAG TPA: GlsB/YeaQ/YmgE family stress response membrane protein [Aldersonia sp.]